MEYSRALGNRMSTQSPVRPCIAGNVRLERRLEESGHHTVRIVLNRSWLISLARLAAAAKLKDYAGRALSAVSVQLSFQRSAFGILFSENFFAKWTNLRSSAVAYTAKAANRAQPPRDFPAERKESRKRSSIADS